MGTKKFDGIVRKKLEGVEAPVPAGNWEAFRKKLEEAPPVIFDTDAPNPSDKIIAQKLEHAAVPGSPATTWPLLEKKLRENAVLRDRVFFYKSLELCLVLFFSVLAWQWADQPTPSNPAWRTIAHRLAPIAFSKSPKHLSSSSVEPSNVRKSEVRASSNQVEPLPDLPANDTEKSVTAVSDQHAAAAPFAESAGKKADQPVTALDLLPPIQSFAGRTPSYPLPVSSVPQAHLTWHIPTIAVSQLKPLPLDEEDREEGVFTLKNPPKRALLNVAMLGSSDYNRVMTPADYRFRINAFDRYSLGYGGGILFGLEYGRMEVGSGFIYAAKQYRPLPVIFIKGNFKDGYVGESLQTVQLNMINLPFYLRFDALRKDKWRAYLSGGASLQVAFEANYFFAPPTSFPADLAQTPAGQSRLRNRTEGWFEGGAFKENSYVTANMAIGVERYVSERWGLFLQPTYHRSIGYFSNGLGPNLDRIHTFSLWTGIRVRVID